MKTTFVKAVWTICLLVIFGTTLAQAQLDEKTLGKIVNDLKAAAPNQRHQAVDQPSSYVSLFVAAPTENQVKQTAMHTAEANRTDKQTESTSTSSGTTSSVTKGSVPWLFALAVEHGALTQSVDGNLITLRGNVANFIKALKVKDYLGSYEVGSHNLFVKAVSRASFAFSFNASSGNASPNVNSNSLASASAHIDLYNHRDPRDSKWRSSWDALVADTLVKLATSQGQFTALLQTKHTSELHDWQSRARQKIDDLYRLNANPSDEQIKPVIQDIARDFNNNLGKFTDVRDQANGVITNLSNYNSQKSGVINQINHSSVVSIEYTYTNQSTLTLPQSSTQTFAVKASPPSLSNINLIFAKSLKNSQLTANATTNLFNSKPSGTNVGSLRDYRFSGQMDVPLPSIPSLGTSSLSFSGLFLSLLEEPLGQQVIVNTVPVSTRGNIGLFQAKWTIPVQNSGVRIPVSFTAANRTELIKEKDVRGSIGISFDFDSLFSKP